MNKFLGMSLLGLSALLAGCGSSSTTILDGTKPLINVGNVDTTGKMTVSVTPSKNANVKSVAIYDNDKLVATDSAAPYSAVLNYTSAQNGAHVIKAVVTDVNNVTTQTSQTVTVNVAADTTKPTVSLATVPATVSTSGSTTVLATASDNVAIASVAFYDNDKLVGTPATAAPYSAVLNYTAADNGTHTIKAVATDTSGNTTTTASQTITVAINVDTTKPTVQVTAPSAVTAAGTVNFSATASDDVSVKQVDFYDNGNKLLTTYNAPYIATTNYTMANNGTHTITAVATDTSGNTAESNTTFNVSIAAAATDTTKPTVTLSLSPTTINSNNWSSVTLSGTATDNVAVKTVALALSVGGQSYALGNVTPDSSGNFSYSVTPATLGNAGTVLLAGLSSVTITAVATDTAGNKSDIAAQTLTITH